MKVQRLRIRYSVSADACQLGQRDILDAWTAACTAAALPLAYSEGKRPSPLLSIAAPLPQGVTSTCELLDLYLTESRPPESVLSQLAQQMPRGICPLSIEEIGINSPSLQSQVRRAQYAVQLLGVDQAVIGNAVAATLSARTLPSEYKRETKVRHYDLRPLILDLATQQANGANTLLMLLRAEPERAARADQVAVLLGLPEGLPIERVALEVDTVPAVLLAHRRSGEREE